MESIQSAIPPLSSDPNIIGTCSDNPVILSFEELCSVENSIEKNEIPKEGMLFDSLDEASEYYIQFAKQEGFAVIRRTTKKGSNGKLSYLTLACSRGGKMCTRSSNPIKPRPQTKIDCPAHITVVARADGKWKFNRVVLDHNHDQSPSKVRYLKCNRIMDEHVKRRLELNDKAGIKLRKTYDSLQIEVGGPGKLAVSQKDCRNHLDRHRRLQLVEGDAQAMQNYFRKMRDDNSDFFYDMEIDSDGRLVNVFWADARSRAAAKEFGDVVTFDTTYLVNKYDMPFAPFVGVNHHGQSILLGCGLISHEDTESFSWLFGAWKTCMWGSAPKAIITDQCMAMKNAIEMIYPETRHRWCIWHIMKKIPEKLSGYNSYESISCYMRKAVYNSLTIEQFQNDWTTFIMKFDLQNNKWLDGLYEQRERWVPAYVKDIFWAGMSSTQRSEGINAYFDGFVHSKTTLKQFVGQYENALAYKVESERQEDVRSWSSFIPLLQEEDEVEKQFQSVYTNNKVKEFHKEFVGKLKCSYEKIKEMETMSEYEVKEWIIYGEEDDKIKKQVAFIVEFDSETRETRCNCRLFEFRGMVCRHQLLVWLQNGVQKVPEKYVLKRWCKNVKRAYTKVRINYDNSSLGVESQRQEALYQSFKKVVDLAEDSSSKFEMAMTGIDELTQALMEVSDEPKVMNGVTKRNHAPTY